MNKLLRVARTEVLEHWRQPSMIAVLVVNYLVWIGLFGAAAVGMDRATALPGGHELLRAQASAAGLNLDLALGMLVSTYGAMVFTNLPLYVAIMSGYSVIHDRKSGTLPFLMLAPLSRRRLLLGKLAGALAIPLGLHVVLVGGSALALGALPLLAPYRAMLGGSPAWWLAFLVGAPASAAFVGALGTVISALSGDVRTSMQYTSFFIGLLSLGFGYALVDGIRWGALPQLAFAGACAAAAALTLSLGAQLISRDLPPS